jgi:hypothetical protein
MNLERHSLRGAVAVGAGVCFGLGLKNHIYGTGTVGRVELVYICQSIG